MCEHLKPAEDYIRSKDIREEWRGTPWSDNCREWIYFDCLLDPQSLIDRLELASCVQVHDYSDIKAGSERGLFCVLCLDGVMGRHPDSSASEGKPVVS